MAQLTQPDTVEWNAGMAQCLAEVGESQEALKLIEEVVENRPDELSYQLLLVSIHLKLGREVDAIAGLELLNRQELLDTSKLAILANLYLKAEDARMAMPVIEKLKSATDINTVPATLSILSGLVALAEWEAAMDLLRFIEPLEKDLTQLNKADRIKAFIVIQQGDNGADQLLEDVISRDPLDGEALLVLAGLKVKQKDFERASMLFERAQKVPVTQYKALVTHGKMLVTNRRYKLGLTKLREALELEHSSELVAYVKAVESLAKTW
jgi:tetratricopeptide (TPR) repeat protein